MQEYQSWHPLAYRTLELQEPGWRKFEERESAPGLEAQTEMQGLEQQAVAPERLPVILQEERRK